MELFSTKVEVGALLIHARNVRFLIRRNAFRVEKEAFKFLLATFLEGAIVTCFDAGVDNLNTRKFSFDAMLRQRDVDHSHSAAFRMQFETYTKLTKRA